ncbi:MAG: FHA domain-containing protein [Anaerolineae bacterium]|nr:FHA domain-containing protein [Anaerolineae bacterium]
MTAVFVFALRILATICLYAFLGWTMYTLWQELRLNSQFHQQRRIQQITIIQNDQEPIAFSLNEILIGRDPSNNLALPDDTVSGRHARLSYHHNQWWIEDLNSTNGTFLNNERISSPTIIVSGEYLRVGKVQMELLIEENRGRF